MQQQKKKDSVILSLGLSLALATTPVVANLFVSVPILAESTSASDHPSFPPPQTVESGTKIRIDGSVNLATINQSLKDKFEQKFSGTQVEVGVNGTDTALKALLDGKIDIAAIARGLTPEEKAQGLEQVRLRREKIAIIVGVNNPFSGNLTREQFAKIFRGEITDWSEIGGSPGKIRFIDHPPTSDTRNSFQDYPVFQSSQFSTGENAIQLEEEKAIPIIQALGKDGISYVLANQISKLPDVRILKIQGITPDSPNYPFSQSLVYVYKQNPTPAVASFIGFTLASGGKEVIEAAREAEASAIAARALQSLSSESQTNSTPENKPVLTTAPTENVPNTVSSSSEQQFVNPVENNPFQDRNTIFLMALSLVPIVGFSGFLAWWFKRKQPSADQTIDSTPTSLTSITNNSETILTDADENIIIIDPFENLTSDDDTSDEHHSITSSHTEDNLVYISAEVPAVSLTATTANPKNTVPETINNLNISEQTISLDCGEVVWDTEAPVAVVNTSYTSVLNMPEISFNNAEIPTDELTSSLLELLDGTTESPAANSTNSASEIINGKPKSLTENATTSLSELLDEAAELSADDSSTTLSEIINGKAESFSENTTTSLSQLLDEATELSVQDHSTTLLEILNGKAESLSENTTTSLSALLDEAAELSAEESSNLLSEKSDTLSTQTDTENNKNLSELLGITNNSSDVEFHNSMLQQRINSTENSHKGSITSLSELLGLSSSSAELDTEVLTDETKNLLPNLSDELRVLFNAVADQGEVNAFWEKELLPTDLQSQVHTTETALFADMGEESSIVFTPRTPKWAYVSWYVSDTHKTAAQSKGGNLLAVRIYDATDLDLSYQIPQLVQQYECEEAICDCYLAIPKSNRDYITEIGYLTHNNRWLSIARSAKVRIFNRPSRDFWFIADTELIIHGSTEPGATVTIGEHKIKLHSDGTFHLRLPFSDSLLNYLITATTADGENSITIMKKFFQESSEN
jgi:phosphate transport system substrate-binding protein